MADYIRSSSIRNYLKENKIVLPDKMAAALVCRQWLEIGMEGIHKVLREIQEQTEDEVLKKQIQRYIEDDLANMDELRKSGTEEIYELTFRDKRTGDYEHWEYYKEFESAEQIARTLQKECEITKHYVIQESDDSEPETGHGSARYAADGKLCFVTGSSSHCLELFDEEYYIYPHPYKRGDILKDIDNQDVLYIVVEDIDPDIVREERERFKSSRDYTDINIWLTGIDKLTGKIFDTDGGIHPYDFEYADIDPDTEDFAERIMLEMQKLLLGKRGSIQFIYDACLRLQEEFRESQERRMLITGVKLRPYNI